MCLAGAKKQLDDLATCVASREKADDEVVEKARCMSEHERIVPSCGPLDLRKVHADRLARLDTVKIKARIDARAAAIMARREKAAADEAARVARAEAAKTAAEALCNGPNVVQLVLALRIGPRRLDLEPGRMRACKYEVMPGTVVNTTRDGWMIVRWGNGYDRNALKAAFKTPKLRADGSFLQTKAVATYLGLIQFDNVDGSSSTLASFKLSE